MESECIFSVVRYSFLLACLVYIYRIYKSALTKKRKAALRDKVVVITGASSGIGKALAHEFYDHGCKVVLAARRLNELARVKQELMSKKLPLESPEPVVMKLDLSDLDECQQFVQKVLEECGHVDILINNAGLAISGSNLKTKLDVHKKIIYVNYFGTVVISNGFLPSMRAQKSGQIVIISSVLGRMATPFRAPYCASKHALIAYGDSLRAEVHKFNIQVTVILPGFVKTKIAEKSLSGVTGEPSGVKETNIANGYSTEYAAKEFITMIANQENEAVLCQPLLKLAMFMRRALPSLFFYITRKGIF